MRGDAQVPKESSLSELFQFTPLCEGRPGRREQKGGKCIFQFTPLCEGRLVPPCFRPPQDNFNSRPCVRGDGSSGRKTAGSANFNSRPCVRGDRLDAVPLPAAIYFNSRPCVRGDSKLMEGLSKSIKFQFTPLCEGRLDLSSNSQSHGVISIHAPV